MNRTNFFLITTLTLLLFTSNISGQTQDRIFLHFSICQGTEMENNESCLKYSSKQLRCDCDNTQLKTFARSFPKSELVLTSNHNNYDLNSIGLKLKIELEALSQIQPGSELTLDKSFTESPFLKAYEYKNLNGKKQRVVVLLSRLN